MTLPAIFAIYPNTNPSELSDSSVGLIFSFFPNIFMAMVPKFGYAMSSLIAATFLMTLPAIFAIYPNTNPSELSDSSVGLIFSFFPKHPAWNVFEQGIAEGLVAALDDRHAKADLAEDQACSSRVLPEPVVPQITRKSSPCTRRGMSSSRALRKAL
ncbi:hypothetical protein [Mycobacterium tuberculosis]|uniref:hypothetical protein n=1 Tax=Mycobacterium tuberculosis TaxID=1773 RepID=UPI002729C13F|nr:hypothetical protein [Mycobacterium tuberculosis]